MDQHSVVVPVFVGIDVVKDRLEVHLLPGGEAFALARDHLGSSGWSPVAAGGAGIVLEATGGFEITVAAALSGARLPLAVVNPRQIRDRPRAWPVQDRRAGRRGDPAVAEGIRPEPRPLLDAQERRLADLVARSRQIVAMIGAESNRGARLGTGICSASSTLTSAGCNRRWPGSSATSTMPSGARPPGGPRQISWPPSLASARSPPAP